MSAPCPPASTAISNASIATSVLPAPDIALQQAVHAARGAPCRRRSRQRAGLRPGRGKAQRGQAPGLQSPGAARGARVCAAPSPAPAPASIDARTPRHTPAVPARAYPATGRTALGGLARRARHRPSPASLAAPSAPGRSIPPDRHAIQRPGNRPRHQPSATVPGAERMTGSNCGSASACCGAQHVVGIHHLRDPVEQFDLAGRGCAAALSAAAFAGSRRAREKTPAGTPSRRPCTNTR